jgi:hypothetical protein
MILITEKLDPPTQQQIDDYLECKAVYEAMKEEIKLLMKQYGDDLNDDKKPDKDAVKEEYKLAKDAVKEKFLKDIKKYSFVKEEDKDKYFPKEKIEDQEKEKLKNGSS